MIYCLMFVILGLIWLGIKTDWFKVRLPISNKLFSKINWNNVRFWSYISGIGSCAALMLVWSYACWYYMITGTPVYFTFNVVNEGWLECILFPTLAILSFIGAIYFGENVNLNKPKVVYYKRNRITNELIGV